MVPKNGGINMFSMSDEEIYNLCPTLFGCTRQIIDPPDHVADVGSTGSQLPDGLTVAIFKRVVEREVLNVVIVVRCVRIYVGSVGDQDFNDVYMTFPAGVVQCSTRRIGYINLCPILQKQSNDLSIASERSFHESGIAASLHPFASAP